MKSYILHLKGENKLVTEAEAIQEAERQEKAGTVPRYAWRDYKTGEPITPPGWLVWSTYADGVEIICEERTGSPLIAIAREISPAVPPVGTAIFAEKSTKYLARH